MPSALSHIPSSRIPGVSITQPPFASGINSRRVVVCLPLPSSPISPVSRYSSPISLFISVDLPTPEEPINAAVLPSVTYGKSFLLLSLSKIFVTIMSTPNAAFSVCVIFSAISPHKSPFVSIITGIAELSHAIER